MSVIEVKKKPNFLVVGAAKAGSSSLYKYLESHPQIFMSPRKEPLYFISEVVKSHTVDPWIQRSIRQSNKGDKKWYVDNANDYSELFDNVDGEVAIGEASATYLYYHEASIPRIKEELGDVKILIILRDPVDKAFSQYNYIRRAGMESLSFQQGIEQEKERIMGNYNSLYHYTSQGFYYAQVKAFYDNFTNVKVILLDDLSLKKQETLSSVYKFLSVDDTFILEDKTRYNVTGFIPKSKKVSRLLNTPTIKKYRRTIMSAFPGLNNILKKYYRKMNSENTSLSLKDKRKVYKFFKEDIDKLEKYLNIDLSSWKY